MKPSAMLYRNLLSIEIEEIIRSYPLDGIVLLAGCDKTVPGAIMGAVSADLPIVLVTSGSRERPRSGAGASAPAATCGGSRTRGRAGRLDDAGWRELERCLACGTGPATRSAHRLDHGHPGRDARADDPRLGHDPRRVPAGQDLGGGEIGRFEYSTRARRQVVVVADRHCNHEQHARAVAGTEFAHRHCQLDIRIGQRPHEIAIDICRALRRVVRDRALAQLGTAPEHESVVTEKERRQRRVKAVAHACGFDRDLDIATQCK